MMPACANAIFDAVGARVDQVPIHPHMVLAAMESRDKRYGPARFPDVDFGETLLVPTPAQGGDGRAINDYKKKHKSKIVGATGTMSTREEALGKGKGETGALTTK